MTFGVVGCNLCLRLGFGCFVLVFGFWVFASLGLVGIVDYLLCCFNRFDLGGFDVCWLFWIIVEFCICCFRCGLLADCL